ncbi:hypothetical protein [Geomonas sp.]|uniref:hypothetical protein n=1 Tax=Geomonas sp. TaxID=2651584 RepID=UPI002B498B36|nr:hypothetical protein [Geomonas sp.]HJV33640.1 hypothetical protein [Geomonas sp.]
MKGKGINPLRIVQEHVKELHQQYRTIADPQKKEVLEKRLTNLYNVLRFLSGREEGSGNVGHFA